MAETKLLGGQATGIPEMDFEYGLQVGLVEAFRAAAADARAGEAAATILNQLADFTNAHYLAEQLLMRLHAYPAYEAHVQDHDRLVAILEEMRGSLASGARAATAHAADSLKDWLVTHTQTLDQAFASYLEQARGSAGAASPADVGPGPSSFPGVE